MKTTKMLLLPVVIMAGALWAEENAAQKRKMHGLHSRLNTLTLSCRSLKKDKARKMLETEISTILSLTPEELHEVLTEKNKYGNELALEARSKDEPVCQYIADVLEDIQRRSEKVDTNDGRTLENSSEADIISLTPSLLH